MKKRETVSVSFNQRDSALIEKAVERVLEVSELPDVSRAQAIRISLQVLLSASDAEIKEVVSTIGFPTAGRPRRDGLPTLGATNLKAFLLQRPEKPSCLYRVRFDKSTLFPSQWGNDELDVEK